MVLKMERLGREGSVLSHEYAYLFFKGKDDVQTLLFGLTTIQLAYVHLAAVLGACNSFLAF